MGHVVAHKLRARPRGSSDHGRRLHPGLCPQRVLRLRRLDPETPDLHLIVDATKVDETSVAQPDGAVAGPVQPFSVATDAERGRGQIVAPQVAPGQVTPAEEDLARHSDRSRAPARIQQIDVHSRQRCAQWRDTVRAIRFPCRGHDCCLGRPVGVDEPPPGGPARYQLGRARLPSTHKHPEVRQRLIVRDQCQSGGRTSTYVTRWSGAVSRRIAWGTSAGPVARQRRTGEKGEHKIPASPPNAGDANAAPGRPDPVRTGRSWRRPTAPDRRSTATPRPPGGA
jgi:hypothetical protein